MNIIDPTELLPSNECLLAVIEHHPFSPNIANCIDTIAVVLSETCDLAKEIINTDLLNRRVKLGLGRGSKGKPNIKYILYHELGHVADRANPQFNYSEDAKSKLSSAEQCAVMELWNLYIDARLNVAGLFKLPAQQKCYSKKHGWLPLGMEGELQCHAVILEKQGITFQRAMKLVRKYWEKPPAMWSYDEMTAWVKRYAG